MKTYKELTDAQQRMLCALANGPVAYNGLMQKAIDSLTAWGLITSDYDLLLSGSRKGHSRWRISCEITKLGREVLFPDNADNQGP